MEVEPNNNDNNDNNEDNNNKSKEERVKGKQKIEIKKIVNKEELMISFSKRRSGIYKKASDLSTLCGAQVGFLVYSPTGKPYSYGNPSADAVFDRLDDPRHSSDRFTAPLLEAHRLRRVAELSHRHDGLFHDLDAQRAIQRDLKGLRLAGEDDHSDSSEGEEVEVGPGWWEAPLLGLGPSELQERRDSLAELHARIAAHLKDRNGEPSGSFSAPPPPPPPPPPPSAGAAF